MRRIAGHTAMIGRTAMMTGVLAAGFALAGCGAPPDGGQVDIPAAVPNPGAQQSPAPPPGTTAPPSDPASGGEAPTSAEQQAGGSQPEAPAKPDNCTAGELEVSLSRGDSGMGHTNSDLRFTNNGERACTLQGSPGVSFVAGDSGQQIGEPAERAPKSEGQLITLQPGESASSPLSIAKSGMYSPDECRPQAVRGLRIYAPGDTASMFVEHEQQACSTPPQPQLTVEVVR
ncbi:MAG: DUF4232 domain-containing protein [Saccharopolyspora sp.]|uniref:DUF4232 domain-containing protein n=1 Tax=Saccharopolyspora sp. TaxID=33915 RepID=UPI0025FD3A36|nr:DUF4232 domain-containing protein [Saccharopolyspora sp.]MBQ6644095.1 DUF4232 domain-containing protein [Saccharopolyspora sp.]